MIDHNGPEYEFYINEFKVSDEGLYPYYQNSKWGYANINTGNIVIPCEYNSVSFFNCGRGVVSFDDPKYVGNDLYSSSYIPQKYKIIKSDNSEININLKQAFPEADYVRITSSNCYFNNILLCSITASGSGWNQFSAIIVDVNGNIIDTEISTVPSDSRNSDFIHDGVFYSKYTNGEVKRILLDENLNKIMPFDGDNYGITLMPCYGEYIFYVQKEDPYDWSNQNKTIGIIDRKGNILCSGKNWTNYYYFTQNNNVTFVRNENGQMYMIDCYGNKVNEELYDAAGSIAYGVGAVQKNGKIGFVDSSGNLIFDYESNNSAYAIYHINKELYWIIVIDGKTTLVDSKGNSMYTFDGEFTIEAIDSDTEAVIITKLPDNSYNIYRIS